MNDYAGHTDAALRALCAGATPGPWVSFAHEPGALYTVASVGGGPDAAIEEVCREPEGDERIADMAFIAAARLALPAALDRVAALEAEVRDARLVLSALIESLGGEITVTAGALIEAPRKIQVWREPDGSMTLRTALGEASNA